MGAHLTGGKYQGSNFGSNFGSEQFRALVLPGTSDMGVYL